MPTHNRIAEVLSRTALFQGVPQPELIDAIGSLRRESFARGHTIFNEGDVGHRLFVIVDGKVKIGCLLPDGRTTLLSIMGPSDMFGEVSIFDLGPRATSAVAVTAVEVVSMERAAVRAWLRARPECAEQVLRVMARRVQRTNDFVVDMGLADVAGRVARRLLFLARQFGVREGGLVQVRHELTQTELGELVGASRETVNKAMSDFAQRGWIRVEGRSVLIIDSERLSQRTRTGLGAEPDTSARLSVQREPAQAVPPEPYEPEPEPRPRIALVMRAARTPAVRRLSGAAIAALRNSNTA